MKIDKYKFFLIIISLLLISNCELINSNLYIGRNNAIVRAIKNISPSVVAIGSQEIESSRVYSNSIWNNFFSPLETKRKANFGSGLIYSKNGYVITNAHVVEYAIKGTIIVYLFNGNSYNAKLVGYDKLTDIALLKIDGGDFNPANIGDSNDLMVGEWAIALGNPNNIFVQAKKSTASAGIISAVDVDFGKQGHTVFENMIQTDASINPGNSGGPLINSNGEVIGINTFILQDNIGISFAIPIDRVIDVVEDLKVDGKVDRAYTTGLKVKPMNPNFKKYVKSEYDYGVLVWDVENYSASDKAGIKVRDVILKVEDKKIYSAKDFVDIVDKFYKKTGQFIKLDIWRYPEILKIDLKLEKPIPNVEG